MIDIAEANASARDGCKGCSASVHAGEDQIGRLIARIRPEHRVSDEHYASRLEACRTCDSLAYESTCMHCGCFVRVRAVFKDKGCPHPNGNARLRWTSAATLNEEA
ncbi:DUF6171 family protein [Cohnella sp. GCM10027633]|uniref:DUF6171 family protein n=1 Tax=unclassified Cohnella TaxID=2636738 RepID=UPI00362D7A77